MLPKKDTFLTDKKKKSFKVVMENHSDKQTNQQANKTKQNKQSNKNNKRLT